MSLANKPAFPALEDWRPGSGMTLLEHYAGLAMQGLLSWGPDHQGGYDELARASIERAKALIAELEKEQSK